MVQVPWISCPAALEQPWLNCWRSMTRMWNGLKCACQWTWKPKQHSLSQEVKARFAEGKGRQGASWHFDLSRFAVFYWCFGGSFLKIGCIWLWLILDARAWVDARGGDAGLNAKGAPFAGPMLHWEIAMRAAENTSGWYPFAPCIASYLYLQYWYAIIVPHSIHILPFYNSHRLE